MTCDIWKRSPRPFWIMSVFITLALVILKLALAIYVSQREPSLLFFFFSFFLLAVAGHSCFKDGCFFFFYIAGEWKKKIVTVGENEPDHSALGGSYGALESVRDLQNDRDRDSY